VQNLFAQGKASPDVALNCQYLVLFNSPVDRHKISLLARRIYPRNHDTMLQRYEEAVSRPYRYLLIDFKSGTAESQRLKTDILSPQIGLNEMRNVIRGEAEPLSRPSDLREPEPIPQSSNRKDIASQTVKLTKTRKLTTKQKRIMSDSEENRPNCDDCGQVFATLNDLQRHVKLRCPDGTIDEPPTKKVKTDVGMSDLTDISKNVTFQYLKYKAEDHNKTQWSKKFGKYVDKDQMDKALATRKADEKIKPEDKQEFFRRYTHLLKLIKHLHTCDVHKRIVDDMMILHCKWNKKTSCNVLLSYKHLFDGMFDHDVSDEESDASEEDDEERDTSK
jgi:hypothetical protein